MVWTGLEQMAEIGRSHFGDWRFPLLMVLVVAVLLIKFRTREVVELLGVCAIVLLVFFNPVVVGIICSYTVTDRYARIFWVFPFAAGIGYAGVRLMENGAFFRKAVVAVRTAVAGGTVVLLAAVLIFSAGGTVFCDRYFTEAANPYKIPEEMPEIADIIRQEHGGAEAYVLATGYVSTYLRQYDGSMRLLFGRGGVGKESKKFWKKMRKYADKDFPYEELYELGVEAMGLGVDTIVLNKYQVQNQALETIGFERVADTENYYIFCRKSQREDMGETDGERKDDGQGVQAG